MDSRTLLLGGEDLTPARPLAELAVVTDAGAGRLSGCEDGCGVLVGATLTGAAEALLAVGGAEVVSRTLRCPSCPLLMPMVVLATAGASLAGAAVGGGRTVTLP